MIIKLTVTTTGSAGSATGTASTNSPVQGWLEAVRLDYDATSPPSTDITLVEIGGMERTLLTVSNANTDVTLYPQPFVSDTAGIVSTTESKPYFIDTAQLQVNVAQCDPLAAAIVATLQIRLAGTS